MLPLLALLLACMPRLAMAQETLPDQAQQVLTLVNQTRANNGLAPLALNPLLVTAAQSHVDDMVANHLYSHTGSDGSSVRARARRIGYTNGSDVSENWVASSGPEGAMAWWMNSYVHRGNILNSKWNEIGVGTKRDPNNGMQIFVLVFGSGQDGAPLPAPVESTVYTPLEVPPGGLRYTVQSGDTLSTIATRYGVSWQTLANANSLGEFSVLQIGQTLYLPGSGVSTVAMGIGGPTDAPAPEYMVKSGDTLISIAIHHNISWEALAAANGLGEQSVLQIGQLLRIPGQPAAKSADTVAQAESLPQTHVVAPGETIITIAQRYSLAWGELLRVNNLDDSTILQVGQVITLR